MKPFAKVIEDGLGAGKRYPNQIKQMREDLIKEGGSSGRHSGQGATIGYFITGLEEAKVPYVLTAFPGKTYAITAYPNTTLESYLEAGGKFE